MDPSFNAILIFIGVIFFIVLAVLAFLMPFFVLKIRNEIVKLNITVTAINDKIVRDTK